MSDNSTTALRRLQRDRQEQIGQAQFLLDSVDKEARTMTQDESDQYDAFLEKAESIDSEIAKRKKLSGMQSRSAKDFRPDPIADREEREGSGDIGLSPKEMSRYSLTRAIVAAGKAREGISNPWKGAEFELECSRAAQQKSGLESKGVMIPSDLMKRQSRQVFVEGRGWQYRDLTVGTATAGGHLVQEDLMSDQFIDLLRNQLVTQRAGATVLSGITGDLAIPKQTGAATGEWVGENSAPTESQQTLGQVTAVPHTAAAFTDFSRKLMLQSSIDVEQFVRNDLASVIALLIDYAGLHGDDSSNANQPDGVETYADITSVVGGTNGAAPTWANIVGLETAVSQDNALMGRVGYVTNSKVRGTLKTTEKASSTGQFIYGEDARMNGYPAYISNQVRSDRAKGSGTNLSSIFFGDWGKLVLALWSGLDLMVDPYTNGTSGGYRVIALQDVDYMVRHGEAFSAMLDAVTN